MAHSLSLPLVHHLYSFQPPSRNTQFNVIFNPPPLRIKRNPHNYSLSLRREKARNHASSHPNQLHALLEDPLDDDTPTSCSPTQSEIPTHIESTQLEQQPEERENIVPSNNIKAEFQFLWGIFTNRWWAELRGAFGQRFNPEGIICAARVISRDRHLLLPHVTVPDIRYIDWSELRRRGFKGVIFDKDNTITLPYALTLWDPLKPSLDRCKSVFGEANVAVFSNSAGLAEFDPDESKALAVEKAVGLRVIKHRVKKPAGSATEIENQLGCRSDELVMVGDRRFTDIVYGNRNGFLTVLTEPLSDDGEPFVVRVIRRVEAFLVKDWYWKGLRPVSHCLLPRNEAHLVSLKDTTL